MGRVGLGRPGAWVFAMTSIEPGQLIDGKFRVERVLGEGGMGVVVLARHVELDQRVAIKLLKDGVLDGDETVQRFMREARALARLGGDHVVRVSDIGRLPSGTPYMVMEYLEGEDLSAILRRRGPLPAEEVADTLIQACAGLAAAHASGLVHRDLKPANLFRARQPDGTTQVKVLDFGIAKFLGGTRLTAEFTVLGSPRYMSPEQLRTPRDVDARADIWALGAIGYRLLTDKPPFEAQGLEDLMDAMLAGKRVPLATARSDLPSSLVDAVERCLSLERGARFESVVDLARALAEAGPPGARELAERIAKTSTPPPAPSEPPPAATVPFAAVPEPPPPLRPTLEPTLDDPPRSEPVQSLPPPRRTPRWAVALGALILLGVAVVVLVLSGLLGAGVGFLVGSEQREIRRSHDAKHIDPVPIVADATRLAREVEAGAALVSIEADPVRGGWVDVSASGFVYFAFQYGLDGGKSGWVEVMVEERGLSTFRHSIPPHGTPVPAPACSLRDAWKSVVQSGVPEGATLSFEYRARPNGATWRAEATGRPDLLREVDGASCKVVPGNP